MQKPEGGGYGETNEIDQEDPSRHWPRLRDEITCGGPGSAVPGHSLDDCKLGTHSARLGTSP